MIQYDYRILYNQKKHKKMNIDTMLETMPMSVLFLLFLLMLGIIFLTIKWVT